MEFCMHTVMMFLFSNTLTTVLFPLQITRHMVPLIIVGFLVLDNLLFGSPIHTSLTTYMMLTTVYGMVCHFKDIFNCFFSVSYTVLDYLTNPYHFIKSGYYLCLVYFISILLDIDFLLLTSVTVALTCLWNHYCINTKKSDEIVDVKVFNDVSDVSEVDFSDDSSVSKDSTDGKQKDTEEDNTEEEDNTKEEDDSEEEVEQKFNDSEDSEEEKVDKSESSDDNNVCFDDNAADKEKTEFVYPAMWCVNLYQYKGDKMINTPFIKHSNMSLIISNTSKHIVFLDTNMRFFFTNFVANVEDAQMITLAVNKVHLGDVSKPANDTFKNLNEESRLYSIIFKSNADKQEFMKKLCKIKKKQE